MIFFFGFHYTVYEGIFAQHLNGNLTDFQDYPIYGYLSYYLVMRAYVWLGAHFPGIPWSSWIGLFFMVTASSLFLFSLSERLKTAKLTTLAVAFLLCAYFIRDSLLLLDMSRYTMAIACSSLLSLMLMEPAKRHYTLRKWMAFFCFFFATLTRIESVIPILPLILLLSLLLKKNGAWTLERFGFPLVLFLAVIGGIFVDDKMSSDYYKQLEPETEILLSNPANLVPVSAMHNIADSTRYRAITHLLYDDTIHLHKTFIESIISNRNFFPRDKEGWYQRVQNGYIVIKYSLTSIPFLKSFSCMIIAIVLFVLFCLHRLWHVPLVFIGALAVGIAIVGFTGSMNERYLQFLILNSILMLFSATLFSFKNRLFFSIAVWLSVFVAAFEVQNSYELYHQLRAEEKNAEAFHARLQNIHHGKIIVYDLQVIYLTNFSPLQLIDYSKFDYITLYDAVHAQHMNHLRHFLQEQCKCNALDWSSTFSYFYLNREKVVFVSNAERIKLKEDFLQNVCALPYKFTAVDPTYNELNLSCYYLVHQ